MLGKALDDIAIEFKFLAHITVESADSPSERLHFGLCPYNGKANLADCSEITHTFCATYRVRFGKLAPEVVVHGCDSDVMRTGSMLADIELQRGL
jgi:hypothetical protein